METVAPAEISQLTALFGAGRYAELEARTRILIARQPASGFAWKALGASLQMQGKDALEALQRATKLLPDDAVAHGYLGNALRELGRPEEAVECYRRSLGINPDNARIHNNLGSILRSLGHIDQAVAHLRRATQISPELAEASDNLGSALRDLGQLDEATASFRQAIELKPDYAQAHGNLGNVLLENGQIDHAEASFRLALRHNPGFADAHSGLLFACNYRTAQPALMLFAEAMNFGASVARQAHRYSEWRNALEADRRLRVGLVSGDLRSHPVGYFIEGMLAALASDAASRMEFIAYSTYPRADILTERIKPFFQEWYSTTELSDENLARKIRDDAIDILLDLSGHTGYNRLPMFAWKPAPVQASWLGYFATTGLTEMDYLIADPWVVPAAEESHFTEKIVRLPDTYLCFTPPDMDVRVDPLPALAAGCITFGCFNNLTKMNDAMVALWARVLQAVPGSRLFLKTKRLSLPAAQQWTLERFAAQGIHPSRVILEGYSPRDELLAAYRRVDIALDPFPFPGGTTSVEALWMGVPVLTLAGDRFLSHIGESILHNAGLPDWIAADAEEYVARAISHAGDLPRLSTLHDGLRQRVLTSPLFDAPRFARHFEDALRTMWIRWCNQQAKKP